MTCTDALALVAPDRPPRTTRRVTSFSCSTCGWHLAGVYADRGAALATAHAARTGCPTPDEDR